MNATECMKGRRSIRKYKKGCIDHSLLESIISTASYSPSLEKHSDYSLHRN